MPPRRLTYLDIADDLQSRIDAGEYPAGSALPSYAQLAKLYSVSVSTVNRAITVLRVRGAVEGQSGVAVWVSER